MRPALIMTNIYRLFQGKLAAIDTQQSHRMAKINSLVQCASAVSESCFHVSTTWRGERWPRPLPF